MRRLVTVGLIIISTSALGQKRKIISRVPNGETNFAYKFNRTFLKQINLEEIAESHDKLSLRFSIDGNKIVEINNRSDSGFSGQIVLHTTKWTDDSKKQNEDYQIFSLKSPIHPDTAKIIYKLLTLNKVDSLSLVESEPDLGVMHDGRSYVIEFSNSDIYSFKTYPTWKSDFTTRHVNEFMNAMDSLLNLDVKLVKFVRGLPKDQCYNINGDIRKIACPGDLKKEKMINNEN